MLYLQSFTFNPFQENTYIIINDKKQCWIVDPGMYDNNETNYLLQYLTTNNLEPQAIINTHAHLDHIFGVAPLVKKYSLPFGLHPKEMPVLQRAPQSATMFGVTIDVVPNPSFSIEEGKPLQLGEDTLEVRFAPGHSPGSVVFYYAPGKWLIGGDVLFSGSIGRTDLPGGDFDTLISSIRNEMFTLPDDTTVHSGHGPATTIGREKQYNPFMKD